MSILDNGFYPRYCLETADHISNLPMAMPMVCFCDIPLGRLSEHTEFYGEYGLGLTKEWALKNGLHPMTYLTQDGPLPDLLKFLLYTGTITAIQNESVKQEANKQFSKFFPLVKPLSGRMYLKNKVVAKDFHQENEWRYVPSDIDFILLQDIRQSIDKKNEELEKLPLKFLPSDIKYIFVKQDSDIPIIFDFIHTALSSHSHKEIKILSSRITSLNIVSRDV